VLKLLTGSGLYTQTASTLWKGLIFLRLNLPTAFQSLINIFSQNCWRAEEGGHQIFRTYENFSGHIVIC
jgi:hypothetical protein